MEHATPIIKRSFRWYWLLGLRSFGLATSACLLAFGSAAVGLALAVILDGFGLAHLTVEGSTGSVLGSGLVIGVIGALALGLAAEMNTTRPPLRQDLAQPGGIATGLAVAVVGAVALSVAPWLQVRVSAFPDIFSAAANLIGDVGQAGVLVVAILGGASSWALRYFPQSAPYADQAEMPILYVFWTLAIMAFAG